MQLGVALPHYDFSFPEPPAPGRATVDRVVAYARLVESLGFHEGWISDHLWLDLSRYGGPPGRQGTPECWTLLAGLAALTTRLRLGSLVLAGGFRQPALLAKMVATLDQVSGGRLDVGLGAGWFADEYAAADVRFGSPRERLVLLEETLGVLRALLADPDTPGSYEGSTISVREAPVRPGSVQRPRPPLWVGGKGDRLLGVVGRAADGWNLCWAVTPERFRERRRVLDTACAAAGRSPTEVRSSLGLTTLIGRDAADLEARWRRLQAWAPGGALDGLDLRAWAADKLVGTPGEILAKLRAFEDIGVEQVICSFGHAPFSVHDDEQLELMAELVLPQAG